ncbi:MAG: hypothetical protein AAFO69_16375 [Bacteroidota bacterium]
MMRFLQLCSFCAVVVVCFSCAPDSREIAAKPSTYYNIDSLLTASVSNCLRQSTTVQVDKQVSIDDEIEEKRMTMDSAALAKEVGLFRLLDINQSNLTFSYEETVSNGAYAYQLKEREKQEGVLNLTITTEGKRTIVAGEFAEKNSLYYTRRNMRIGIEDGCLKYYQVAGVQKMTFKDTVSYTLKGAILE